MKTRKWLGTAAFLAAVGMLAACSGGTNATGSSDGDSGTITLASVDTQAIGDVVKAFETANPGVKVEVTTGGVDQYQQQVRTQLASGTAPDVLYVWPGNGNPAALYVLAKAGYLVDLSDQSWANKLPNGVKSVAQYDNKTYAALFGLNGIGAIYNQQAMAKAGLTPPTTWSGLLTFCRAAAAKGTPAFSLGLQTNWIAQLINYALVPTTVYSANPTFDKQMQAGKATFVNSGWMTSMNKYLRLNQAGCFQKNPLGTSYESSQSQVASGKALAMVQGNWVISLLKKQNPTGTFEMRALPATDNPSQTWMAAAPGAGYGINANSKKKALALRFVNFLMSPAGMGLYAQKMGGLAVFPDAKTSQDQSLKELTAYVAANKTVPFMDQLWPNAKVQQDHLTGVQDIFAGRSTPTKVLQQMDTDYKAGT